MKEVIVASQNPVKVKCVQDAFSQIFSDEDFQFEGVSVPSGVSDQPMTDEETYQGALNRANNGKNLHPAASYWIGIEGGIDYHKGTMEAFAWIVVLSNTQQGKARTSTFTLPKQIQKLVEEGMELGHADDQVFDRQNSKKKSGAVGILTNDLINRSDYYEQAVILALIPFLKSELYC